MSNATWLHDLRTPLMTILANAEHLEALAENAPGLRDAIAHAGLQPEQLRQLTLILDDLAPIARDLTSATRAIRELLERFEHS